jgi:hypothetical protein
VSIRTPTSSLTSGFDGPETGKEGLVRPSTRPVAALVCAVAVLAVLAVLAGPIAAQAATDLPRRAMNDEVFTNAKGWLIFKGDVEPGWEGKNVQVYKRLCKSCEWQLVKKVRTDGTGRWRTRIYAPETGSWYWKGLVPKADGYGKSVTQTWRTFVD